MVIALQVFEVVCKITQFRPGHTYALHGNVRRQGKAVGDQFDKCIDHDSRCLKYAAQGKKGYFAILRSR